MNRQYWHDYRAEQSRQEDGIRVYRGLGDEDFPEVRAWTKSENLHGIVENTPLVCDVD